MVARGVTTGYQSARSSPGGIPEKEKIRRYGGLVQVHWHSSRSAALSTQINLINISLCDDDGHRRDWGILPKIDLDYPVVC